MYNITIYYLIAAVYIHSCMLFLSHTWYIYISIYYNYIIIVMCIYMHILYNMCKMLYATTVHLTLYILAYHIV